MIDERYVKSDVRIRLFEEMETQYDTQNKKYFKDLLSHEDSVIRTRVICILADISGMDAVESISRVLESDKNALVRHEAASSLGQLGYPSAISALSNATKSDPSYFVRHEAAVALGVIGSEGAREILNEALKDKSEEVRESAIIALANIDYVSTMNRNNKFTKMTGG
jgi:HEAT repeat protein